MKFEVVEGKLTWMRERGDRYGGTAGVSSVHWCDEDRQAQAV